jgi:hypothetical protein
MVNVEDFYGPWNYCAKRIQTQSWLTHILVVGKKPRVENTGSLLL